MGRQRLKTFMFTLLLGAFCSVAGESQDTQAATRLQVTHVNVSVFPTVSFQLHVTDPSGMPLASLVTSQFSLTDGGKPIASFHPRLLSEGQRGTDVLLLIDVGISYRHAQVPDSQAASRSFIQGLGPSDRVSVTSFDRATHPLTPFTADKNHLSAALGKLSVAKYQSKIYDSLYSSLQRLNDLHQRYAVILLTDGADDHSRHTKQQVVALARQHGITIYTVALGTDPVMSVLGGIAGGTGGQTFQASNDAQLRSIYQRLVLVFRHDYLVTYTAPPGYHRGQRVLLQIRYAPPGSQPIVARVHYTVPFGSWLHLVQAPTSLGTVEDPQRTLVPVTLSSEDKSPQRVEVRSSGWPGMRIQPSAIIVPPYAAGQVHQTFVLSTRAGFPSGRQGSLTLHFQPTNAAVRIDRSQISLPYKVPPSVLRVADLPTNLHSVSDLGSGHTIRFTVYSTVFKLTGLHVTVTDVPGSTVAPSVIRIPSARSESSSTQSVVVRVPGAAGGQHGSFVLQFIPVSSAVKVKDGSATVIYYVPTWWERNWKWVVPTVIVLIVLIWLAITLSWEYITESWDTRRRAALGR